jgi:cytochrome P450
VPELICPMRPSGSLERTYDPFTSPQLEAPGEVWSWAREHAPVFYSELLHAWVITRYDDVVEVLRDPEVFGSVAERKMFAAGCPEADAILATLPRLEETNPLASDPPIHTKLRKYLQLAFLPKRVAPLELELRRIANDLVDGFIGKRGGDLYSEYAYKYPLTVICRLVGLPDEDHERVKGWASHRIELRNANLGPDEQLVAARAQLDYHEFTLSLVADRRAHPANDLLSWIVADSDVSADPLTEEQLASMATSLLTAGHETTSNWLTMTLRRLLADRPRWESLVADPDTAIQLVEESLRIDGPVQSIWRLARQDAMVGGVPIPAGSRLSVVLGSANGDGHVFEDPDVFMPERENATRHLTFGRGPHTCIGAGIARLEGRITLETLAARLPGLALVDDGGMTFRPSATQRIVQHLHVTW